MEITSFYLLSNLEQVPVSDQNGWELNMHGNDLHHNKIEIGWEEILGLVMFTWTDILSKIGRGEE